MDSKFTISISSQLGKLILEFNGDKLSSATLDGNARARKESLSLDKYVHGSQIKSVMQKINNYFSSAISLNSISVDAQGTAFQKSVWHELSKIPLGETRTYGDIAKKLNSSARAVGNACRKNPIAIIVPCHRVVSAKGLGGYAGETEGKQLNIKRWLLEHEGVHL